MASGSLHQVARSVAESARGTTPTTPVLQILRDGRFTGGLTRTLVRDPAIKPDRNLVDARLGPKNVAFSLPFTLAYGAYDTELEALLMGTWTDNRLKNGTTRRYFTYERKFTEFSSDDKPYLRYPGSELNTMELTISNGGAIVEGSFGLIGLDQSAPASTIISGATYTAAPTDPAFGSFDGSVSEGGSVSAIVTELKLNVSNGIEAQHVIGDPASNDSTVGDFEVSGSVGLQYRNNAMLDKALAETTSSISVTLEDLLGSSLVIELPKIKFDIGTPDVSQKGLVSLTLPFTAMYDSTAACTMSLTRTPHA